VKRSVIALISLAAIAAAAPLASAAEAKIGVVSISRLMQDAPQARSANDVIRAEFAPREKEIQDLGASLKAKEDKLARDSATMTEMQRSALDKELRDGVRSFEIKQAEIQDDFNVRRNEEIQKLQRMLLEEVQVYAKAQGYDIILAEGVLYASPAFDVTGPVLQALQSRGTRAPATPAPAAAPARQP